VDIAPEGDPLAETTLDEDGLATGLDAPCAPEHPDTSPTINATIATEPTKNPRCPPMAKQY
jgi:hypothetical protein